MARNTIAHNTFVTKTYPLIRRLSEDTVQLLTRHVSGFSKLGGNPTVPEPFDWPYNGPEPLNFICQLKISDIHHNSLNHLFPEEGLLYFFFREDEGHYGWGDRYEDRKNWRVLFYDDESTELVSVTPPESTHKGRIYKERFLEPHFIRTFPAEEELLIRGVTIPKSDADFYDLFRDSQYLPFPMINQVRGHPLEIQRDTMDVECHCASRGIDPFDDSKENQERINRLLEEITYTDDFILLFQLDSDEYENMNWGDGGRLYFFITRKDLIDRNFDNVWMILQSH